MDSYLVIFSLLIGACFMMCNFYGYRNEIYLYYLPVNNYKNKCVAFLFVSLCLLIGLNCVIIYYDKYYLIFDFLYNNFSLILTHTIVFINGLLFGMLYAT